jgi:hypothetical protein
MLGERMGVGLYRIEIVTAFSTVSWLLLTDSRAIPAPVIAANFMIALSSPQTGNDMKAAGSHYFHEASRRPPQP